MNDDFWKRCANAGCVVCPVMAYSEYKNGNISDDFFIGIRYAALQFDNYVVAPDYWFMIDESFDCDDGLFLTPEEALKEFEKRRA